MQRSCSAITQLHGTFPSSLFSLAPQTLALLSVRCSPTNIARHKLQFDVASELSVRAQHFPLAEQTKVDTVIRQGGAIAGTFHDQSRWSAVLFRIMISTPIARNYLYRNMKATIAPQEVCTFLQCLCCAASDFQITFVLRTPLHVVSSFSEVMLMVLIPFCTFILSKSS